jgi:hypothetical protein
MKHPRKKSSPSGVRRRSRRVGGLAMIAASFGIAVPRMEPPLDAPVLDWEMMGPAFSSAPHHSRRCPFCMPVPSFPDVKKSMGTRDHS